MATTPDDQLDDLRSDLTAMLQHQYETVRQQEDVRDRWHRFYTITTGATLSLAGLLGVTLLKGDLKLGSINVMQDVLPHIVALTALILLIFGVLHLGLYLSQIVSYHVNYFNIARITKTFAKIHETTISSLKIDDPFGFTYAFLASVPHSKRASFIWQQFRNPQAYAADFWANCQVIAVNTMCVGLLYIAYSGSSLSVRALVGFLLFIIALVFQILLRQIVSALAIHAALSGISNNSR